MTKAKQLAMIEKNIDLIRYVMNDERIIINFSHHGNRYSLQIERNDPTFFIENRMTGDWGGITLDRNEATWFAALHVLKVTGLAYKVKECLRKLDHIMKESSRFAFRILQWL